MADTPYGALHAIDELEAALRPKIAGVSFDLHAEGAALTASAPRIIWFIESGEQDATIPQRRDETTRAVGSDWVEFRARCIGESRATATQDPRRQEYRASEAMMALLRQQAKKLWPGVSLQVRWQTVPPVKHDDRGCPIDVSFKLRIDVLAVPYNLVTGVTEDPPELNLDGV